MCLVWDVFGKSNERLVEHILKSKFRFLMDTTPKFLWIEGTYNYSAAAQQPGAASSSASRHSVIDLSGSDADAAGAANQLRIDAERSASIAASVKWQTDVADNLKKLYTNRGTEPHISVFCGGTVRQLNSYHYLDPENNADPSQTRLGKKFEYIDLNDHIPLLWRWQSFGMVTLSSVRQCLILTIFIFLIRCGFSFASTIPFF
jgi:hypothetical protein